MNTQNEPIKNFKIGVSETKKFEIPEINDGAYPAVLKDMELRANVPDGKGGTFDMLQWDFEVDGKIINGKTSTIISGMSKAFAWITAMDQAPKVGSDFDPKSIIGKKCTVVIKHQKRTKTYNGSTETQDIPYVSDVLKVA
jgi:hypothetical protein